MQLEFTKMQSLGNDFVVLDGVSKKIGLAPEQVRRLADRHLGIGCDQLLLAEPAKGEADFRFRIFNADGGEVGQCGNGARCFARFLREKGLTDRDEITVETLQGRMTLALRPDGLVTVEIGVPRLEPAQIPLLARERSLTHTLDLDGAEAEIVAVNVGNPHAVLVVEDVDHAPVAALGPKIEHHPAFPEGANAGFMEVVDRGRIRLRVHERGVGETLACGSGASAAVAAGRLLGLLDEGVVVSQPGGEMEVSWAGEGEPLFLTGTAVTVFQGVIET